MSFRFHLHYYRRCESTQDLACRAFGQKKAPHGTIYRTAEQTHGMGREGRKWVSRGGENLLFSLIVRPRGLQSKDICALSWISALVIRDIALYLGIEGVRVKWPNDVWVGEEKLAGILLQGYLRGARAQGACIGFGINVNQCVFEAGLRATSLKKCLQMKSLDIEKVFLLWRRFWRQRYGALKKNKAALKQAYEQALWGLHRTHRWQTKQGIMTATLLGITKEGHLTLRYLGKKYTFSETEIRLQQKMPV